MILSPKAAAMIAAPPGIILPEFYPESEEEEEKEKGDESLEEKKGKEKEKEKERGKENKQVSGEEMLDMLVKRGDHQGLLSVLSAYPPAKEFVQKVLSFFSFLYFISFFFFFFFFFFSFSSLFLFFPFHFLFSSLLFSFSSLSLSLFFFLLEIKITSPFSPSQRGGSVLHWASTRGSRDLVDVLLSFHSNASSLEVTLKNFFFFFFFFFFSQVSWFSLFYFLIL